MKVSTTKFLKVKCNKCKNEQVIFERAATPVNCLVCNDPLAIPTGGRAKVIAKILESYE